MTYELDCQFDSRKSFYGKAIVEEVRKDNITELLLYSYNTLVAKIEVCGNKTRYYGYGKYSQTTTRHQKEFFKQYGLSDKEIKELFKNGVLTKMV